MILVAEANAYFSGFASEKRVTLYYTLINNLDEKEIVAVLAHEVGHYKKKPVIFNMFSRAFEYQADNYAKNTYKAEPLISSLKKLSKNSLSNLTPHPAYVFMHYSHPTLLQRIRNLKK